MPIKGVWCSVSSILDASICSATLPCTYTALLMCRLIVVHSMMRAASDAPFSPFFPSSLFNPSNSELFTFFLRPPFASHYL